MNDEVQQFPVREVMMLAVRDSLPGMAETTMAIGTATDRVKAILKSEGHDPQSLSMAELASAFDGREDEQLALHALSKAPFKAVETRRPVSPEGLNAPALLNMLSYLSYSLLGCEEAVAKGFTPSGVVVMIPLDNGTVMLRSCGVDLAESAKQLAAIAEETDKTEAGA